MRRKGFTLIELLAVIVILVIIALITTPLILNVLNDVKEKSRLRSIENIADQAYFYYTKHALVSEKANGNIFNPVMEIIKGEKPDKGEIFVKKEKIGYALRYGDTCYKKKYDESVVTKIENAEECTLVNTENYLVDACITRFDGGFAPLSSVDSNTPFLSGPIKRGEIEKIVTLGHQEMGANVINSWDVSEQENNSILAWYKDEDENGLYEVYIGQEDIVVANSDSDYLFGGLTNLVEIDLNYLYEMKVTNMDFIFGGCKKLTKLDLNNFDTSNVTSMFGMFSGCSSLTELKIDQWGTSNVTTMRQMFYECTSLTELNLENFDTSKVTEMSFMFDGCKSLIELNLNSFDTSNVISMHSMFRECSSLTELNLNHFNTSNVINMGRMFWSCENLVELNIGNWDTSNVTSMGQMFSECTSLTELNIENFNTSNVTEMNYMFEGCSSLTTIQANASIKDKIESAVNSAKLTGVTVQV